MNRKAGKLHTLRRKGAPHCLRSALALPAALAFPVAALLLYSCDPPASTPGGTETKHVETRSDGSTITTKTTAGGITKELVIHPSVTSIEDNAFRNSGLTSLTIGNSVKTIGKEAFAGNPKLKTVRITGTGAVETNLFIYSDTSGSPKGILNQSGSSGIELIIEDGITAIGAWTFSINKLTSLTIGNSVNTIGNNAFYGSQLTSVTIPPSVTVIRDDAFSFNKLKSVILPKALYDARGNAFDGNPPGLRFRDHKGRALGTN